MLKDKTVVVTGGSRGIGSAICREFAKAGANIAIIYSIACPDELINEICGMGVRAAAYKCDVSDFSVSKETCAQIIKDFGGVEVLVNNAGITKDNLILRMTEQAWDDVLNVNLKGSFNMIKHFSQPLMRNQGGAIINITSVVGLMGNAGQANYAASKAGLIGLTKSVARELSARNITCNAIAPGFIETGMTAVLTAEQQDALIKSIPLRRTGKPEEVAKLAVFLATNRYITGEVIKVDGGLYI